MSESMHDDDIERRLGAWMAAAAPHPSPGFADRVLRETATTPQRASWTGWFAVASAVGAAAAVALAVVIGLQFGRIAPGPSVPTGGAESVSPSPSPSPTPTRSETPPSPSETPTGVRDVYRCENATDGYALDVPSDWYANPRVEAGEGLDDVAACRFFGPTEFEIAPNAGLPAGVAISVQVVPEAPPPSGEVVESGEMVVDGRDATVRLLETTSEGLTPAGTLVYEYLVVMDDGRVLLVGTDSSRDGDFEEHRDVLDAMMESLDFS